MIFKEILVISMLICIGDLKSISDTQPRDIKTGQVVFLGDSITAFWNTEGQAVWNEHFAPLGAVNTAIPGWTTQNIIDDISGGSIDNLYAYLAVLKVGINDLTWAGGTEESVARNIQIILEMIKAKSSTTRIILLGILPTGDAEVHQKCRNVNAVLKTYADNSTVFFLDMDQQFANGLGQVKTELYTADQVHLAPEGYVVWQRTMALLFESVLNAPFEAKVVWLGDSLTYHWFTLGWPMWNARYRPLQTKNLAAPGAQTRDTLIIIEQEEVLKGLNPKLVTLMIGGNDLTAGYRPTDVSARIARILDQLRIRLPHARILLLGLLPAGGVPDSVIEAGKQLNDILAQMAGDDVTYLDMRRAFSDENDQIYPELYVLDRIHLSYQGFSVWNTTWWPTFDSLLKFDYLV